MPIRCAVGLCYVLRMRVGNCERRILVEVRTYLGSSIDVDNVYQPRDHMRQGNCKQRILVEVRPDPRC